MNNLKFLTEVLGIVMKHDPITMAKTSAVYERRIESRNDLKLVPTRSKS